MSSHPKTWNLEIPFTTGWTLTNNVLVNAQLYLFWLPNTGAMPGFSSQLPGLNTQLSFELIFFFGLRHVVTTTSEVS